MAAARKQIELSFKAHGLKNADLFSKSDPVLYCEVRDGGSSEPWKKLGHTEVVDNNLNPEWCNGFVINHLAGEIQNLRFTVLDYDATNKDGTLKGDSLGSCETTVDEITKSSHRGLSLTLSGKGSKAGSLLHVMWESVDPSVRGDATLTLSGIDLANRAGMLSSSSPFWRLLKRRPDGVYVLVGKSEVVKHDRSPMFKPVTISLQRLCNGDMSRELRLEVQHYEKDDASKEIGTAEVGVTATTLTTSGHQIVLKHPKGEQRSVGFITVTNALLKRDLTFQQYVDGGLQVSLIVAIDFTGSNGDPKTAGSLHYISSTPTAYESAFTATAAVLAPYDSDGKIEMLGFGAQPKAGAGVSHCFALTGNEAAATVDRDKMVTMYREVVLKCNFSGPTNCAPIINKAAASAKAAGARVGGPLVYDILLLLTDGEIDDMDATMAAIAAASSAPLSIVVCGVGSCDFAKARALNDVTAASRDIVQFLRMDDFGAGAANRLAAKILDKLPNQVETYFAKVGIAPGKK